MPNSFVGRRRFLLSMLLIAPILLTIWLVSDPGKEAAAVFPGQNGRLVYSDGYLENIYTINPDGSCGLGPFEGVDAAWSPDGLRIAAAELLYGSKAAIVVMDADGSNRVFLTQVLATDTNPSWSPDGQQIVFVSDRDGNPELYVMNADGSGQIRLTNSAAQDYYPVWSPDGNHIVFESNATGDRDIYILDLASSDPPVNLTNTPGEHERMPDWSPDGMHIVFDSVADGGDSNGDIFMMDADGSNRKNLTKTTDRYEKNAIWSPDGTLIAFKIDRDDFYTMKPDGSDETFLFKYEGYGAAYLDDWQPVLEQETKIEVAKAILGPNRFWPFTMTGVPPFELSSGACKVFAGVAPGTYKIEEQESAGYDQSVTCSNGASGGTTIDIEIASGERVTCTFVNAMRPDLTIYKYIQGSYSETEWSFVGTGEIGQFTISDALRSAKFEDLDPGEYTITEQVPEGFMADVGCDDYAASTGEGGVTLDLVAGRDVTCTFINRRLGDITIAKVVVGDPPGVDWQFGGDLGNFTLPATGGEITFPDIPAGIPKTIRETQVAGYYLELDCRYTQSGEGADATPVANGVQIRPDGQDVTCKFINSSLAGTDLTIEKVVVGDAPENDWEFAYGNQSGSLFESFTLPAAGGSITRESLPPGRYGIGEQIDSAEGYVPSASCSDGSVGGSWINPQLEIGVAVTCTFTNTQMTNVTIVKQVVGEVPPAPWQFSWDYIGSFELPAAGGSQSFQLPAGMQKVREAVVEGYSPSVICTDGTEGTNEANLELERGEDVVCTFTNIHDGTGRRTYLPVIRR